MDGQLDTHFLNHLEPKLKESRFARVDYEIVDKLIEKDETRESKLTSAQESDLTPVFQSQLPGQEMQYFVSYESLSEEDYPVMITQSEFMRRMKDMQEMSGQASMYGTAPDSYNLVKLACK